jgi:hypothetical protein
VASASPRKCSSQVCSLNVIEYQVQMVSIFKKTLKLSYMWMLKIFQDVQVVLDSAHWLPAVAQAHKYAHH